MASSDDIKVWVRMPKNIHALVSAQAERERRSVNAQILVLLERALGLHGGPVDHEASRSS